MHSSVLNLHEEGLLPQSRNVQSGGRAISVPPAFPAFLQLDHVGTEDIHLPADYIVADIDFCRLRAQDWTTSSAQVQIEMK